MLRGLLTTACRWLQNWRDALSCDRVPAAELFAPPASGSCKPLERVVLTDGVVRTLFDGFAEHRTAPRGEEEVGWLLLGLREEKEAVVMATLPAGADREAGVAHVLFNSTAQAVGSRVVRQANRRLRMLGVVHTHPGTLRHPSDGDYQGDSLWVGRLHGREGVFAIGTADSHMGNGKPESHSPHEQVEGELRFSWYALREGDRRHRRLPVAVAKGPDLARPLHPVWGAIELHAEALDRLCNQLANVTFEVEALKQGLLARFPVAGTDDSVCILLRHEEAQVFLLRGEEPMIADPQEPLLDRAVFLVLGELARKRHATQSCSPLVGKG
jgi:proteasome lid subunit RPN8/RPN11